MPPASLSLAYIGLGSNLNDPESQVRGTLEAFSRCKSIRLIRTSAMYRNPPMGPADQPDFINAVALIETKLSPRALLDTLLRMESERGRIREPGNHWGPRAIDLDILLYDDRKIDQPDLKIPHPGISKRNFVLFPLLEVEPDLWIPGLGKIKDIAAGHDSTALIRIGSLKNYIRAIINKN